MIKRLLGTAGLAATLLTAPGAFAAERTVTLAVGNLFCSTCPYIIEQVLVALPGVARAKVSYRSKTAVVTFDDEKTEVAALTAAAGELGFPSRISSPREANEDVIR